MQQLMTAAQMRGIEQAAIQSGAVTGYELMERAGAGVVEGLLEWRPELTRGRRRALVCCGPGNNGGDGFVVARLLKNRGWEVDVHLLGEADRLPPDAAEAHRRWRLVGEVAPLASADAASTAPDIVVDAVFGGGLNRPIVGETAAAMRGARAPTGLMGLHGGPRGRVAVDCPSGLCLDSGRHLGESMGADLTVTFHKPKLGHLLHAGPEACGRLVVKDIGLDRRGVATTSGLLAGPPRLHARLRQHKYSHGHVLVLAGGVGRGGAARMAARSAFRAGAGLVTVAPPPAAIIENAARLDAIMLRPVADADALSAMLQDPRITAVALGMGLGVGERTRALTQAALSSRRKVVLDADAMTSFRDDPEALWAMTNALTVLTPHMGEFAALFPDIAERLTEAPQGGPAYSKVDAARDAVRRSGAVVVLKGHDTVIASPTEPFAFVSAASHGREAPYLATAGAGDVLAGFIAGRAAGANASLWMAAGEAAWLHVEAARRVGPGLIAEDLPDAVPRVLRRLSRGTYDRYEFE